MDGFLAVAKADANAKNVLDLDKHNFSRFSGSLNDAIYTSDTT
jgi:hypothetical protein